MRIRASSSIEYKAVTHVAAFFRAKSVYYFVEAEIKGGINQRILLEEGTPEMGRELLQDHDVVAEKMLATRKAKKREAFILP